MRKVVIVALLATVSSTPLSRYSTKKDTKKQLGFTGLASEQLIESIIGGGAAAAGATSVTAGLDDEASRSLGRLKHSDAGRDTYQPLPTIALVNYVTTNLIAQYSMTYVYQTDRIPDGLCLGSIYGSDIYAGKCEMACPPSVGVIVINETLSQVGCTGSAKCCVAEMTRVPGSSCRVGVQWDHIGLCMDFGQCHEIISGRFGASHDCCHEYRYNNYQPAVGK